MAIPSKFMYGMKVLKPEYDMKVLKPETLQKEMTAIEATIAAYRMQMEMMATMERKETYTMARQDEALFTIYRAANGFYAKMADDHIVVGTTLSETSNAAAAEVAKNALEEPDDVTKKDYGSWKMVRK